MVQEGFQIQVALRRYSNGNGSHVAATCASINSSNQEQDTKREEANLLKTHWSKNLVVTLVHLWEPVVMLAEEVPPSDINHSGIRRICDVEVGVNSDAMSLSILGGLAQANILVLGDIKYVSNDASEQLRRATGRMVSDVLPHRIEEEVVSIPVVAGQAILSIKALHRRCMGEAGMSQLPILAGLELFLDSSSAVCAILSEAESPILSKC
jgi:hypothetical protein